MRITKKTVEKTVIVLLVIFCIATFKYLGLGQYLTLEYLKQSQAHFAELYAARPLPVIAVYMLIYIVATALSLPGAVIMTLAGGALFGLVMGTVIISFASTIGATLACAVARFLLRDWVQKKFGERLGPINSGIEREGGLYLFTMRLVPVFPFFLINLAMGVTRIPLLQYYWISQVGMLPATIVYVNAGKELGRIDSLSSILSPSLLVSFALLGLFPLTVKKIMGWVKGRKDKKDEQV
ncbi:MAG: TVP38/TMEM64 family protein [Deltaproteobacteria bacterium]|nr:TVP38/TMEM64 family protein [Deltaproteobacteria bacterium]